MHSGKSFCLTGLSAMPCGVVLPILNEMILRVIHAKTNVNDRHKASVSA